MTNTEHQLNEITEALRQVIAIEQIKARQQVLKIIATELENGTSPHQILEDLVNWATEKEN
jgi:hypothetical protein